MWWSTVVQLRGQSMKEACADPAQFLCSYDGGTYGERQAKKMAKRVASDYIFKGANIGQPRLLKTPLEPFGAEEFADVERALAKGLVPPGMTLEAAEQLRGALEDAAEDDEGEEGDEDDDYLSSEAAAAARAHGIDFDQLAIGFERKVVMPLRVGVKDGEHRIVPIDMLLRVCRIEIALAAGVHDDALDRASAASLAANESGDPATAEAAFAYYDRKLGEAITENDLEPVVEALQDTFFSKPATDEA
jgi:hypothetical protein